LNITPGENVAYFQFDVIDKMNTLTRSLKTSAKRREGNFARIEKKMTTPATKRKNRTISKAIRLIIINGY